MSARRPRTLAELRAHPDVRDVWSEGEDGWWLDAAPGFRSPATDCHVFHESTLAELAADFNAREECACEECAAAILRRSSEERAR